MGKKNNLNKNCQPVKQNYQKSQINSDSCEIKSEKGKNKKIFQKTQNTKKFFQNSEGLLQCLHCKDKPMVYQTRKQILRHIKRIHSIETPKQKNGKQQCPVCNEKGFFLSNLKIHMAIHQQQINFDLNSDLRLVKSALKYRQCIFCPQKIYLCNLNKHYFQCHSVNQTWEQIQKQFEDFIKKESFYHQVNFDLRKQFTIWKTKKVFERFPKENQRNLDNVDRILSKQTDQLFHREQHAVLGLKNLFEIHHKLPQSFLRRWLKMMLGQAPQFGDEFVLKNGSMIFLNQLKERGLLTGKMQIAQRTSYRNSEQMLKYIVKTEEFLEPTRKLYQIYENLMCVEAFQRYQAMYAEVKEKIQTPIRQKVSEKLNQYNKPQVYDMSLTKKWNNVKRKLVSVDPTPQLMKVYRDYYLQEQRLKIKEKIEGLFISVDPWLKTPRQKKCFYEYLAEISFDSREKQIQQGQKKVKQIQQKYVQQVLQRKKIGNILPCKKYSAQQLRARQALFWKNVDELGKNKIISTPKTKKIKKRTQLKLSIPPQLIAQIKKQSKWKKIGKWQKQQRQYGLRITRQLTFLQKMKISLMQTGKAKYILRKIASPNLILQHQTLIYPFTDSVKIKTVLKAIRLRQKKIITKFNSNQAQFEQIKIKHHKSQLNPEPQPEHQPELDLQLEPEPQPQHQPELDLQLEPEPQPQYQPELDLQLEPEPKPQYQPELDFQLEPEDQQRKQQIKPDFSPFISLRNKEITQEMLLKLKKFNFQLGGYKIVESKPKQVFFNFGKPKKNWEKIKRQVGEWFNSEEAKQLGEKLKNCP